MNGEYLFDEMMIDMPLFFTEFLDGSGAESSDILDRVALLTTKYTNFYTLCDIASITTAYTQSQTCAAYKLSWRGIFNLPRVANALYSFVVKLIQNDLFNAMIGLGNLVATFLAYEYITSV